MDSKHKPSPNSPEPSHDDDDLFPTSEAAPPSYSASYSQPDNMPSQDNIAPSARSAPPLTADAVELKANYDTQPTMEYARPPEPQGQHGVDYKTPFGDSPVPVQCPVCQQRTVSKTTHVSGGYTL